jgi:hypothetical protein
MSSSAESVLALAHSGGEIEQHPGGETGSRGVHRRGSHAVVGSDAGDVSSSTSCAQPQAQPATVRRGTLEPQYAAVYAPF